jgi:molecular chaperone GrpE
VSNCRFFQNGNIIEYALIKLGKYIMENKEAFGSDSANTEEQTQNTQNENTMENENLELEENQSDDVPSSEDLLKEAQDKYLRLYSDFDNFRKRTQKEKADLINYAAGDVLKDFLGVVDDFDRALEANEKNQDVSSIKEGFNLLYAKLEAALKLKGLTEMECKGIDFDSELHEAITSIDAGDEMKGKIVDVIQKGYFLKERVLRHAKVVVGQ